MLTFLLCALVFQFTVKADYIETETPFALEFVFGDSFQIYDDENDVTITFEVVSGTLTGTATLNATTSGGVMYISPTSYGAVKVTGDTSTFYVLFNGATDSDSIYTYSSGTGFIITWSYSPPAVSPIIVGTTNTTLYFRSDQYTTNNNTGYGLDDTNTDSAVTISDTGSGDAVVTYGFRVWVVKYGGTLEELTAGTPVAQLSRSTDGSGYQNNTWTPTETSILLGYDALKVSIYVQFDSGDWTSRASYISNPLINSIIYEQTWTFIMYTSKSTGADTTASFRFGAASTYNSRITGAGFKEPSSFEIGQWRLNSGDYIAFTLGAYTDLIGPAAYLFMLLVPCGVFYMRYRNIWAVLFMFVIFGGSGGMIWALVPIWAAAVIDAILLIACAFLLFKIIR